MKDSLAWKTVIESGSDFNKSWSKETGGVADRKDEIERLHGTKIT